MYVNVERSLMENQSDINFNEYHFLDSYCNQLSEYDPIKKIQQKT